MASRLHRLRRPLLLSRFPVAPLSKGMPFLSSLGAEVQRRGIKTGDVYDRAQKSMGPLIIVSAYTNIDTLAHQPRGDNSNFGFYVYRINTNSGALTLLSVQQGILNPAFSRFHPTKNLMYAATESIHENGLVYTYSLNVEDGTLTEVSQQDAGGASTCYLTVDREENNMLFVNYWDSTLGTFPLADGKPVDNVKLIETKFDAGDAATKPKPAPKAGEQRKHSLNDPDTAAERQSSAHAHSIVLDPYMGTTAYVPDLGQDCVHQYHFDEKTGALSHKGKIKADATASGPHGPRYIEFHKKLNVAYLINEMSCCVSVFKFDPKAVEDIHAGGDSPSLEQIQAISTVPDGFPTMYNTCGRIAIDPTGNYVLVSNRGHDSIAVFKILGKKGGMLSRVGFFHTRGCTPRHFAFDESGRYLIAANQDSNLISVFDFNPANGVLSHTGNDYVVPSPNFICAPSLSLN